MNVSPYDDFFEEFLLLLDEACRTNGASLSGAFPRNCRLSRNGGAGGDGAQGELFPEGPLRPAPDEACPADGPFSARLLAGASLTAYHNFFSAWLSELPVHAELLQFGWNIIGSALRAEGLAGTSPALRAPDFTFGWKARQVAERARADRLDSAAARVHNAAFKVIREQHRLTGFLRFRDEPFPDSVRPLVPGRAADETLLLARCSPDHRVLPLLAPHFELRLDKRDWGIIDEKRGLLLLGRKGKAAEIYAVRPAEAARSGTKDGPWEELWRLYFTATNNESRANPGLQRRFMPSRYRKYLTEMRS